MTSNLPITMIFMFIILFLLTEGKTKPRSNQCIRKHHLLVCPSRPKSRDEACSSKNEVMITVSPLIDKQSSRQLEVVWYLETVQKDDMIRMYKSPDFTSPPVFEVAPNCKYGFSETKIFETFLNARLKLSGVCLGYWVAYWRDDNVLYSSCLQTNPTWMEDYQSLFGGLRLYDMFIPGTHDSCAYHTVYTPEKTGECRLQKYVYTQEENILEQLLHGARYLDLRVGRKGGVYYAHHGVARLYPFQEVIRHIRHFMEKTNEIVILDFHDFPVGFAKEKQHLRFVQYLYNELSELMASPHLGWNATLQEIWDTGRHLIVSYNKQDVVDSNRDILWPPITQMWGNKQQVKDLYAYLSEAMRNPPEGMWSAQAELTAEASDLMTDDLGGLRRMATETNTQVTKWFRGDWGQTCHIVAMDFIRASAIVDVAIELNLRRAFREPCPDETRFLKHDEYQGRGAYEEKREEDEEFEELKKMGAEFETDDDFGMEKYDRMEEYN